MLSVAVSEGYVVTGERVGRQDDAMCGAGDEEGEAVASTWR